MRCATCGGVGRQRVDLETRKVVKGFCCMGPGDPLLPDPSLEDMVSFADRGIETCRWWDTHGRRSDRAKRRERLRTTT